MKTFHQPDHTRMGATPSHELHGICPYTDRASRPGMIAGVEQGGAHHQACGALR